MLDYRNGIIIFCYAIIKKSLLLGQKGFLWSGWQDSNLRPPAPKAGAITELRYTPKAGANIGLFFTFTKLFAK